MKKTKQTKLRVFFLNLSLNGQSYKIFTTKPFFLVDLVTFFNFKKQLVIIEHNGKIFNSLKIESNSTFIKQNDKIEIITIVGGG